MEAQTSAGWDSVSVARRRAFLILDGLFAVGIGLGFFTWIALVGAWFQGGEEQIHRVHNIGWGALGGILLSGALVVQLFPQGRRPAAMQQFAVGIVCFFIGAGLSADFGGDVVTGIAVFLVAFLILLALHPDRLDVFRTPTNFNPALGGLVVVGAVPLISYALTMAHLQRLNTPGDLHAEMGHWLTMATLAIAIVLVGALASFRPPGWRIPAWSAGLALAVFGLSSVVFPDYAGSAGSVWGAIAMVGAVAFVLVSEFVYRREAEGVT